MSPKLQNLVGNRYGRLTVLSRNGTRVSPNGSKKPTWECQCDCGNKATVIGQSLKLGTTQSCGCLQIETTGNRSRTHGMTRSPEYQSWRGMWERCTNPNNNHFKSYGSRGISVCDEWKDFSVFLRDMGSRPKGTSLERADVNKGYGPSNCKWATPAEQSRNTTRTVKITWGGRTMCMKDWAAEMGLTGRALRVRINRWGLGAAMTTDKFGKGSKHDLRSKNYC